jgi:hypothetical protein
MTHTPFPPVLSSRGAGPRTACLSPCARQRLARKRLRKRLRQRLMGTIGGCGYTPTATGAVAIPLLSLGTYTRLPERLGDTHSSKQLKVL